MMPFLIAIAVYAIRIARRPLDARLKKRHAGPLAIATGAVVLYLAWDWLRPADINTAYFLGEFAGVGAIYLMTCTLVLASRLKWLEQWFGGLDRMYFWHRRYALWSVLLLAPHILASKSGAGSVGLPHADQLAQTGRVLGIVSAVGLLALVAISLAQVGRIMRLPYARWLFLHRLIGLLVLLALVHGWALDQIIAGSVPLLVVSIAIGVIGMVAYGYVELVLPRREPRASYTVHRVERPAPDIVDVTLTPAGPASLPLTGGQFVYLRVGGSHAWREHPFSVAGTPGNGSVRLTIRARGRDTRRFYADLREGQPATLSGPYGMFDHTLGGGHQIWIAGGIGIAPFLGWLSQPSGALPHADLFYSTRTADDAPFLPELAAAAERHPEIRFHAHSSRSDGRLTADRIQVVAGPLTPDTHVFLCGPTSMVEQLALDLRRRGIPRDRLHSEHFTFR
jgi:predicted ferric reductase